MKMIKRLLIAVGIIFFASYIVRFPIYNQDCLRKGADIYSTEHMCKHPTLNQNMKEILKTNDIAENIENPVKSSFIFAKVKVIFEITNIPVYQWQLARGNLNASHFIGLDGWYNKNIRSIAYFPLTGHILKCRQ